MKRLFFLLLLLSPLLGANAFAQSSAPDLGKSLGNEACRADSDPAQARPSDIFCGDNPKSVGRVQTLTLERTLPDALVQRREEIEARAKLLMEGLAVSEQLSCEAGQFLGQGDVLLYLCTMQSTSWPRLLLVSGAGRSLVVAQGMPSLLPVLDSTISAALGR